MGRSAGQRGWPTSARRAECRAGQAAATAAQSSSFSAAAAAQHCALGWPARRQAQATCRSSSNQPSTAATHLRAGRGRAQVGGGGCACRAFAGPLDCAPDPRPSRYDACPSGNKRDTEGNEEQTPPPLLSLSLSHTHTHEGNEEQTVRRGGRRGGVNAESSNTETISNSARARLRA